MYLGSVGCYNYGRFGLIGEIKKNYNRVIVGNIEECCIFVMQGDCLTLTFKANTMIKASEFRIGNYVTGSVYGGKGESQWVHVQGRIHTIGLDIVKIGDGITWTLDGISGIPINEEWLLRLGFMKYTIDIGGPGIGEESDQWSLNGYSFLFDINERLFLSGYNWNTHHMQYVHQLQNLYFALTGEELTIKETV